METELENIKVEKYPAYKNSGLQWMDQIPCNWEVKKLKYILIEINERSETGEEELLSLSKSKGVIPKSSLDERAGQANSLVGYKKVYPESIVINKMQAVNGLLAVSKIFGITSPDYSVYKVLNNNYEINYFGYLLSQPEYLSEFKKVVTGVMEGFIRLYTDDLYNIKAHLPPLPEQTAIASFLDRKTALIDQAIDIKKKQIELLKERRQILIHKAVTRGLNPNVKMKDSGVEWIGEVPEGWEVLNKMKFISSLKGRQGWQGLKAEEYKTEGPHVLSSAHFNNYVIDWDKCPRVSIERYLMDEHIQLNIGDILLMKDGANMGKLALVEHLQVDVEVVVAVPWVVQLIRPNPLQVVWQRPGTR